MTVQPHPYLHSLHDVSFSYIFKSAYNMIIGCKLATTEYGAETFFQSQLVQVWMKWNQPKKFMQVEVHKKIHAHQIFMVGAAFLVSKIN